MTRSPLTDPRPGDVVEGQRDGISVRRTVCQRIGNNLEVADGGDTWWMSLPSWRRWCANVNQTKGNE